MFSREPALWLGAINAILALAVAFGLPVSNYQLGMINAAMAAILSLIIRAQVSPVRN